MPKMKIMSWNNRLRLLNINTDVINRLTGILDDYLNDEVCKMPKTVKIKDIKGYYRFHVFKVSCEFEGYSKNVYVKMGRDNSEETREGIRREYDSTAKVFRMFDSSLQFYAPRPIRFIHEKSALILEEVAGIRLDRLILSKLRFHVRPEDINIVRKYCVLCARWLLEFQSGFSDNNNGLIDLVELEERISREMNRICDLKFQLDSTFKDRIKKFTREILDEFEENDLKTVAKHNDFAPWNVIVGDNSIGVLDYTNFKYDSRYYDICYFYESLGTFRERFMIKGENISIVQENILNQFSPGFNEEHKYFLYFRVLYLLQRIRTIIFRSQDNVAYSWKYKSELSKCLKKLRSVVFL